MKRRMATFFVLALGLAISLPVVGWCAKSSGINGMVVDAEGRPIAGIKVIAIMQGKPIKGYEQFDTTTWSNGSFQFKGLYPVSTYVLVPWSEDWTTDARLKVQTLSDSETWVLSEPLIVRKAFARNGGNLITDLSTGKPRCTVSTEGVISDSQTGLEWVVGPDKGILYKDVEPWVNSCKIAGGGWRMPTMEEVQGLFVEGLGDRNMEPVFKTTGWWVCVAAPKDNRSSSREGYYFHFGAVNPWVVSHPSFEEIRAFAVRSVKK